MTKPIGTDGDVSRGEPSIHQNEPGIQAEGTYRRNLIGRVGVKSLSTFRHRRAL
jgi:hypothetical protein